MKRTSSLILPLLLAPRPGRAESTTETDIRRSVVRITSSQRLPQLLKPWLKQNPREVAGSGVLLEGRRILTNAHLVAYASQIYMQPYQSSDKLPAKVIRLAPSIDLAVLELEDGPEAKSFFQGRWPLDKASDLPEPKDAVSVYGYPIGFVEIEFNEKYVETLVFNREQVLAAMEEILSDNGIREPCSADLRDAWKAAK
jgi:S1-C subfamily serine protease